MKIINLQIITLVLILQSCHTTSYLKTDDSPVVYRKSDPEKIKVYATPKIDRKYIPLGQVIVGHDSGNTATIVNLLKNEAANLGADGIINLRLEIATGFLSTAGLKASGTAVKFENQ